MFRKRKDKEEVAKEKELVVEIEKKPQAQYSLSIWYGEKKLKRLDMPDVTLVSPDGLVTQYWQPNYPQSPNYMLFRIRGVKGRKIYLE